MTTSPLRSTRSRSSVGSDVPFYSDTAAAAAAMTSPEVARVIGGGSAVLAYAGDADDSGSSPVDTASVHDDVGVGASHSESSIYMVDDDSDEDNDGARLESGLRETTSLASMLGSADPWGVFTSPAAAPRRKARGRVVAGAGVRDADSVAQGAGASGPTDDARRDVYVVVRSSEGSDTDSAVGTSNGGINGSSIDVATPPSRRVHGRLQFADEAADDLQHRDSFSDAVLSTGARDSSVGSHSQGTPNADVDDVALGGRVLGAAAPVARVVDFDSAPSVLTMQVPRVVPSLPPRTSNYVVIGGDDGDDVESSGGSAYDEADYRM